MMRSRKLAATAVLQVAVALLVTGSTCVAQEVPDALRAGAASLLQEVAADTASMPGGGVAVLSLAGQGHRTMLTDSLCQVVRASWPHVLASEDVQRALDALMFNASDLQKAQKRDLFLSRSSAGAVLLLDAVSTDQSVHLKAVYAQASRVSLMHEVEVPMSDEIRRYLSMPVPATLRLIGPPRSTVMVDDRVVGYGGQPFTTRLTAGLHSLGVKKDGYETYKQTFFVESDRHLTLKVRAKDNRLAPIAATASGAVVPGLASVLYGHPKAERDLHPTDAEFGSYFGAVVFYVSAGIWASYKLDTHEKDILAGSGGKVRKQQEQTAALVAFGGWGLNVFSAYFVGLDYLQRNRQLQGYAAGVCEGAPEAYAAGDDRAQPRLTLSRRWRF